MQSGQASTHDSRTLLVDASIEHGRRLSEQLNHAGFRTDLALSWRAAHAALGTNYYHSCVMTVDLDQPVDLEELADRAGGGTVAAPPRPRGGGKWRALHRRHFDGRARIGSE